MKILLFIVCVGIGYAVHPILWSRSENQTVEKKSNDEAEAAVVDSDPVAVVDDVDATHRGMVDSSESSIDVPIATTQEQFVQDAKPMVEEATTQSPEEVLIEAMKTSLSNGDLTTIRFEEVKAWKTALDREGKLIGVITAEITTVLGVKSVQAKALVNDGTVQEWTWAKTGAPLK